MVIFLWPGKIISILASEKEVGDEHRYSGRWLVNSVEHVCTVVAHRMMVVLSRDSCAVDPNEGSTNLWSKIIGF